MSGTSTWREIRGKRLRASPELEEGIAREREIIEAELRLAQVRKHRKANQTTVAKRLAVSQARVSAIERGPDPKLSTVAGYVQALGGRLELRAIFDDESVTIGELGAKPKAKARSSKHVAKVRGATKARRAAKASRRRVTP